MQYGRQSERPNDRRSKALVAGAREINVTSARSLPPIIAAVVAICFSDGASAGDRGQVRHAPTWSRSANGVGWKKAARARALAGNPHLDPAAPYRANSLASSRQPIVNIPSQTTVVTRRVMDDKDATTVRDVLRTTPGVTVGR
jgi:outer membrane receptor for Fe3+-dicitrate